jgi:hypothetical protein
MMKYLDYKSLFESEIDAMPTKDCSGRTPYSGDRSKALATAEAQAVTLTSESPPLMLFSSDED